MTYWKEKTDYNIIRNRDLRICMDVYVRITSKKKPSDGSDAGMDGRVS